MSVVFEAQVRAGLDAIYQANPKLPKGIAGDKRIMETILRFTEGKEVVPSPELYSLALQYDAPLPDTVPTGPAHTYDQQFNASQAQQVATEQERANRAAWEQILERYGVASHEANYNVVKSYCQGVISLERFEFMVANLPKGTTLDWSDEKEKLLDEILDLLEDKYQRRMTTADLKSARMQMQYWTRQQLRARLTEVKDKQALAKKSVAQIQNDLAAHREQERKQQFGYTDSRGMMWPRLLTTFVPRGQVQAISTSQYLRELVRRRDPDATYEYRRMTRLYGDEQITRMTNAA